MTDCCCPGESEQATVKCPACGAAGKPVSTTTLRHMVKPEFLSLVDKGGFLFCPSAECDVVYFHPEGEQLGKREVRVRVGLKEKQEPLLLCYCFGFTEGMVWEEVERTGRCSIPGRISAEVKAGHCACEIRNPQGSCCLGNVQAVVKRVVMVAARGSHVEVG